MQRAFFIVTIFLSSGLLFLIQPMVARIVLPAFGGSPAVWTASNLFFQAVLLLGYLYAHLSVRKLGPKRQPLIHLPLMAIAALTLPFALPSWAGAIGAGDPTWRLLLTLAIMIGLPFFCVSAGAPLIQRWFSTTRDKDAADPYFLYSASNLASLVALLLYPFLIEPTLRLREQTNVWAGLYLALLLLMAICGVLAFRGQSTSADQLAPGEREPQLDAPVEAKQRLMWIALAAVPSSLLLGVTNFISVNVAPVPMMWVIPLAVYLLTFILAFAKHPILPSSILGRAVPLLIIPLALMIVLETDKPLFAIAGFHLIAFFVLAWMCHARLYESRPGLGHLTEFYVWISVGGVLGGLFNAIIAPVLFNTLAEYPLALVLALMLRPSIKESKSKLNYLFPALIAGMVLVGVLATRAVGMEPSTIRTLLTVGLPLILCIFAMDYPVRFALAMGAVVFMAAGLRLTWTSELVTVDRSFFGVHRVTKTGSSLYGLLHGNTIHGLQDRKSPDVPLTYYHPTGPIGQAFRDLAPRLQDNDIALVGMGIGSIAAYGEAGMRMTFFEIDPVVRQFASDPKLFTFLQDSKADIRIVMGDARLTLAKEPDGKYELIVLDAFSSDAIPIHLLTVEAFQMYFQKLKPGGVITIHISNRYLDLEPVLRGLVARLKLKGMIFYDAPVGDEADQGKTASTWVALAREEADFGAMLEDKDWTILDPEPEDPVWSDDFSNLWDAFQPDD